MPKEKRTVIASFFTGGSDKSPPITRVKERIKRKGDGRDRDNLLLAHISMAAFKCKSGCQLP